MATNPLKRVSQPVEDAVKALAEREDRTFIAQLDRVVDAGLRSLGEPGIVPDPAPTPTTATTAGPRKARRPARKPAPTPTA